MKKEILKGRRKDLLTCIIEFKIPLELPKIKKKVSFLIKTGDSRIANACSIKTSKKGFLFNQLVLKLNLLVPVLHLGFEIVNIYYIRLHILTYLVTFVRTKKRLLGFEAVK